MQGLQRPNQFQGFRGLAKDLGFGRIREAELRTRITIDPAAQTAAADKDWFVTFYGDADAAPVAERTLEPRVKAGQPIPNEYLMCFPTVTLEVDQLLTTLDDVKVAEFLKKVGRAIIQIKNGTDILFEKRAGYYMSGLPGCKSAQGTLAAGAAASIRHNIEKMVRGGDFDDPLLLFPGASLNGEIHSEGTWVGATAVTVDLSLDGWIATRGTYDAAAKAAGLGEVINQAAQSGLDAVRRRLAVG